MRKNPAVPLHESIDRRSRGGAIAVQADRASLRATLRASTAADHRAIDATLSGLDLANATDYRRFLRIQLAALANLSTVWGMRERDDLESLIGSLRTDLSDWGPTVLPVSEVDAVRTPFTEAGIAYVVRGSRIGATVLVDRVGPHFPIRYLSHRPVVSWPAFLAHLNALDALADPEAIDDCIAAARAAFAVFARAAHATPAR